MKIWQKFRKNKAAKSVDIPATKSKPSIPAQQPREQQSALSEIGYIIAVASGKGGVGKSTISYHLAVELAQQGHQVGLLDADLYGPSQTTLLGDKQQAEVKDGLIQPREAQGVKFISMASVNPQAGAMVVRSPIAIKALQQFLHNVAWGKLDFLIIDLPPGTGDIQLSLAQKAELSGAIVVTTPQNLASEIAEKSIQMFQRVDVPVLGIVENMSLFECPKCQHQSEIFQAGGGQTLADKYQLPLLAQMPLDIDMMREGTLTSPLTWRNKIQQLSQQMLNTLQLGEDNTLSVKATNIYSDQQSVTINWQDGKQTQLSARDLRLKCGCALCKDEFTGEKLLEEQRVAADIKVLKLNKVGRYGIAVRFSDGHTTGIYRLSDLY